MYHDAAHEKEEAECGALAVMEEVRDADDAAEPGYRGAGRFPKEVHTYTEKDRIEHPRDNDPLPELMFGDELMGFYIRLEGYDNFFQQKVLFLFIWLLSAKPTYL
jgi:hypothetical protein